MAYGLFGLVEGADELCNAARRMMVPTGQAHFRTKPATMAERSLSLCRDTQGYQRARDRGEGWGWGEDGIDFGAV